jgi:RDD family
MKGLTVLNRLLAVVYDIIIQIIIVIIVLFGVEYLNTTIFKLDNNERDWIMWGIGLILFFIFFGLIPIKLKGTIGKFLVELEVISTKGKFTFGRWIFRELFLKYGYLYLGLILLIQIETIEVIHFIFYLIFGLIMELFFIIVKRKTIHDYYLKTIVKKTLIKVEQKGKNLV